MTTTVPGSSDVSNKAKKVIDCGHQCLYYQVFTFYISTLYTFGSSFPSSFHNMLSVIQNIFREDVDGKFPGIGSLVYPFPPPGVKSVKIQENSEKNRGPSKIIFRFLKSHESSKLTAQLRLLAL